MEKKLSLPPDTRAITFSPSSADAMTVDSFSTLGGLSGRTADSKARESRVFFLDLAVDEACERSRN